jgi:hypothetical protein
MNTTYFWSTNPATQVADIYLRVRRAFPSVTAANAIAFARMTVKS